MAAKILTISNQKGGVGKTTTAVSLAHYLARKSKVLLIDLDPQGQCATNLGLKQEQGAFYLMVIAQVSARDINFIRDLPRETGRDNLSIIPGDQMTGSAQTSIMDKPISYIREVLKPFQNDFDYIIFDTSPSLGGLQERAVWAADAVVIPCATEFASLESAAKTVKTLKGLRAEKGWKGGLLGILPTFYDDKTRESRNSIKDLKEQFGEKVMPPIHAATVLRECWSTGQTIFEYAPDARAAHEYEVFASLVKNY
jgi:chromosome partitioning protein